MGLESAIGSGHVNWRRLERKLRGKNELKNFNTKKIMKTQRFCCVWLLKTFIWQEKLRKLFSWKNPDSGSSLVILTFVYLAMVETTFIGSVWRSWDNVMPFQDVRRVRFCNNVRYRILFEPHVVIAQSGSCCEWGCRLFAAGFGCETMLIASHGFWFFVFKALAVL